MPLKTLRDEQPSMNLTPMIDVVFLLLIFFMVATRFADAERNIELQVPTVKSAGAMTPPPDKRTVHVRRDGSIALDEREVTPDELRAALAQAIQEYPATGVVVRGDGQGSFQNVADALAACREAGISDLGITVRIADGGPAETGATRR